MALRLFQIFFGTSSRMRGKRGARRLSEAPGRNIPAYAGKTPNPNRFEGKPGEHPRIRGENFTAPDWSDEPEGTSPHTRGKRKLTDNANNSAGEHPRIRGENGAAAARTVVRTGTSPHTRGKQAVLDPSDDNPRNIPAYAGKTGGNDIDRRFWEEHPRIRGENAITRQASPR